MDSLQGIPVEYKLDAFNMPRTGTTLCHPILLSTPSSHFTSGPLWWRQRILSPNTRHETHGDIQSSIPTTATYLSLNLRTQSLTRPTTHAAISTFSTSHNSISSQYSQPLHESCSTKSKPNTPCCKIKTINKNKNLRLQNHPTNSLVSFGFISTVVGY